jgi:hypothetical protein
LRRLALAALCLYRGNIACFFFLSSFRTKRSSTEAYPAAAPAEKQLSMRRLRLAWRLALRRLAAYAGQRRRLARRDCGCRTACGWPRAGVASLCYQPRFAAFRAIPAALRRRVWPFPHTAVFPILDGLVG